jgi:hypothetical protein
MHDGWSMPMESFTLAEAKRWIRRMVITKTAFEADHSKHEAEQQSIVIGVHGQHSAHGDPLICLAVQFWPEEQDALPLAMRLPRWKERRQ